MIRLNNDLIITDVLLLCFQVLQMGLAGWPNSYSEPAWESKMTRPKKFKCEKCGKMSTNNADLQKHMRVHTGEKPFQCPVCGVKFNQKSNMTTHVKKHHFEEVPNDAGIHHSYEEIPH